MQIPVYNQQTNATGLGPTPRANEGPRDERQASLGPGLMALGHGFEKYAEGLAQSEAALARSNEQQAMTRAALAVSAAHATVTQELHADSENIFKADAPQGFDGLVPRYNERINKLTNEALEGVSNERARAYVQTHMAHLAGQVILPKTLAIEANARSKLNAYNLNGVIKNNAQVVDASPEVYDFVMEDTRAAISNSGLSSEQREHFTKQAAILPWAALHKQVRTAFGDFATKNDEELSSLYPAWKDADPHLRDQIRAQALVLQKQTASTIKATFDQQVKDHVAAFKEGYSAPPAQRLKEADFTALYGADSREWQSYNQWASVGAIMHTMKHMSDTQIRDAVRELRPAFGAPTELFASFDRLRDKGNKQILDRLKTDIEGEYELGAAGMLPRERLPSSRFTDMPPEVEQEYLRNRETFQVIGTMHGMTDKEAADAMAKYGLTGERGTAVQEARNFKMLTEAFKRDQKRRDDDLAAYVAQPGSMLAELRKAAFAKGAGPEAMEAYLNASSIEQKRLRGYAVLTTAVDRDELEAQINAAPKSEGASDELVGRFQSISKRYGRFWPDVAMELQAAKKKLPAAFYGVLWTDNAAVQAQVAMQSNLTEKEMIKSFGLDERDAKAVRNMVDQAMYPLVKAIGGASESNTALLGALQETITKLAYAGMKGGNTDHKGIVERAVRPFLGMYEYFPNGGDERSFMVPKGEDPGRVADGATRALRALKGLSLTVPPSVLKIYKPEEAEEQWKSAIERAPVWSIGRARDGLVLSARDRHGNLHAVLAPNGSQVFYSWEALRGFADPGPTIEPRATDDPRGPVDYEQNRETLRERLRARELRQ